jgi:predicted ArsR family transcriptional regulator
MGRRTHIIQILRDAPEPLSVQEIANAVGIHANTARFHLKSLVDAGLATRETVAGDKPGRPRVVYIGTLPNQTHERAQGYRLLSQMLTNVIAHHQAMSPETMHEVGEEWGRYLTRRPAPFEHIPEEDIYQRVVDKLDALWFAPELPPQTPGVPERCLLFHNCPFIATAVTAPDIVCQLHAGMVNGSLAELNSGYRVARIVPQVEPHLCQAYLDSADQQNPPHVIVDARHLEELDELATSELMARSAALSSGSASSVRV